MSLVATTLLSLLSLGSSAGCPDFPKKRTPVILIADVGIDDAGALLLALASPELDILGVVASFGGHDDVRVTKRNAEAVIRVKLGPVTAVHVCHIGTVEHGVGGTLANPAPPPILALPVFVQPGEVQATHAPLGQLYGLGAVVDGFRDELGAVAEAK